MRTILLAFLIDLFVHAAGCFLTPIRNIVSEWIVYNLHIVYNVNLWKCTEKQHFRNKYGKTLNFQGLRGMGCTGARAVYCKMWRYVNRIAQGSPTPTPSNSHILETWRGYQQRYPKPPKLKIPEV